MDPDTDWLSEVLQNVQLEQFYLPIKDQLQITRLAHFDYVHPEDLERIGISKPGIRRLLDSVRKRKLQLWNRKFWNKLFGSSSSTNKEKSDLSLRTTVRPEPSTTCIILKKDIILHNELGNGSFGVVRRGEWKVSEQPLNTVPVAVKVLKADAFSQPEVYDDFRREMESMHSLKHPNLIKLHGVVFHPLMMVCELASMGALLDYIRAQNGKLSLNLISRWSEQVAAGMAHLEKHRFLHRDLACRNILLSSLELIKIGDFGLMRALPDANDCYVMSERRRVPFPWCAPESLRTRQFSHASDVWMFAVALWEMYTFGEEPWIGMNGSEILRAIMSEGQRLSSPNACPPDVYMLMMQCWDLNPKERPTFAGILRYMETNKFETATAALSYHKQGRMTTEAGDPIILIDKRSELHWWKGQNQRTLEVGLFPSNLVTVTKNKSILATRKSQTVSPMQKGQATSIASLNGSSDDSSVVLRKRRTIETTQAPSTRSGNTGSKHFNYNKLTNERAATMIGERVARGTRDAQSKSLNQVREDLLIDLDLPPSTRQAQQHQPKKPISHNRSILDDPIDVPETNLGADWDELSSTSLNYSSSHNPSTMYGAKSLENLVSTSSNASRVTTMDPFDTSQFWSTENQNIASRSVSHVNTDDKTRPRVNYNVINKTGANTAPRPNYDLTGNISLNQSSRYSANNSAGSSNLDLQTLYCNKTQLNNTNSISSGNYGMVPVADNIYSNSVVNSSSSNVNEPSVAESLAQISLDDKISESLNLRSRYSDNIYSNSASSSVNSIHDLPSTSNTEVNNENRFNEMVLYENFEINPNHQQFLLETKDFYTKASSPAVKKGDGYEKNIYVPKYEDDGEKLKNFSVAHENSKNYSAMKYQNVDHYQYTNQSEAGTSSSQNVARYDEANDASSNFYSEIGDSANQSEFGSSQNLHSNGQNLYSSSQNVYGTGQNLHSNSQNVYGTGQNLHSNSQNVYGTGQNLYSNSQNVYGIGRNLYASQNVYGSQATYNNATSFYDEVYESTTPRPHRPAPPCPAQPK